MKKIIIIILVSLITSSIFSQQTNVKPELTKQNYFLKSKHQKTAAFLLLGSGVVECGTGLTLAIANATVDVTNVTLGLFTGTPPSSVPMKRNNAASTFLILGTASVLSSIPLFAASAKNKRKALNLSFKTETIPRVRNVSFVNIPVPSLSLHINL